MIGPLADSVVWQVFEGLLQQPEYQIISEIAFGPSLGR